MKGDPGYDQRGINCTDVRTCVENSRRQRTLFLWKPFRNALDARREHSGFAEPEGRPGNHKAGKRICDCMSHGGEAPENHGNGITYACAQAVYQAAHKDHAQRIGGLKGEHQMSIADVVPAKLLLQRTFQHAEHLPVHVVLGYTEKQESADDPAEPSGEDANFLQACKRPRWYSFSPVGRGPGNWNLFPHLLPFA